MASSTTPTSTLPIRNNTDPDDVIPDEDSSEVTKLFLERLQAWKHACGYLEDYIKATAKVHSSNASDYEKHALKAVSDPLKEAHHFDKNLGGISGLFENIKTNTQTLANTNAETAKSLKGPVLDIFERLHAEIKHKAKELNKGAGKGAKAVDKARAASQKHIEILGQNTAAYDAAGGVVKSHEDPYLVQRQVYHRLHKQVSEENESREDMLAVQNNFAEFEAHVVRTFQAGLGQFNQVVGTTAEKTAAVYGDILGTGQRIPLDFEWNGFVKRNANVLIDPTSGKRSVENIAFPNQDHQATKPLIAGVLERKSGVLKKYDGGFYAVTPSKYLHEFKSDDDFSKDPSPENSLYLPDCLIGAVDGAKFNIRGKDSSKGAFSKLAMTKEFEFKAATPEDAKKWHSAIASITGAAAATEAASDATPVISQPAETASPTSATSTTATTGVVSGATPATEPVVEKA